MAKIIPDEPVYEFKHGALYISDAKYQMGILGWPNAEAKKRLWYNKWKPFSPEFQLVKPYRSSKKKKTAASNPNQMKLGMDCSRQPNAAPKVFNNKKRAFDSFRFSLPKDLAKGIDKFRSHQWLVIVMASIFEEPTVDMLNSNPVLAYVLANNSSYQRMLFDDEKRWKCEKMLHMKQREVLRRLKYPDSKRMVKIFKKISPAAASPEILNKLKLSISDESIEKSLLHLDSVNGGVLSLILNPVFVGKFTPKFMEEVSESRREDYFPYTANMIKELLYMFRVARPRVAPPLLQSIAKLQEYHHEIAEDFERVSSKQLKYYRIPPPPLKGTEKIVPITTIKGLKKEGKDQSNCVGSYAKWISEKHIYIYKVLRPERATLSIVRGAGGAWHIRELRCSGNHDVKPTTTKAVNRWLSIRTVSV